jgi:hypothetical protein
MAIAGELRTASMRPAATDANLLKLANEFDSFAAAGVRS